MSQFCTEIGRLRVEHRIILITESAVLVVLPGRRIHFKLSDPFLKRNGAIKFDYERESSNTDWVSTIKWWHSDLSWSSGSQHGYQASALSNSLGARILFKNWEGKIFLNLRRNVGIPSGAFSWRLYLSYHNCYMSFGRYKFFRLPFGCLQVLRRISR